MFNEHTSDSVGVIGLGIIGSRAADRLRHAGKHVYVWSPTPRPVPHFLASPVEVAATTKRVQLFVRDGAALIETVTAMRDALTHEHVVINSATVSPDDTRKAASIVQGSAAAFLDCPFTGSRDAAARGELVYYVGGNKDVLDAVRHLLDATSTEILHVGEIGHATVLKLATNMVTATTVEILAEALALTLSQGISGDKLGRAISLNACNSGVVGLKLASILARDFTPHFSLENMLKDARYAAALAKTKNLDLPVHTQTTEVMDAAMTGGQPPQDFSIIAQRLLPH